jgi:hypothetical protein
MQPLTLIPCRYAGKMKPFPPEAREAETPVRIRSEMG